MLQAVMTQPGKIEIHQVEKPSPGPGEVLIAVRRIGVCGSDIHVYHGQHPYTSYPVVQGHEVSGVIAEVGPGVGDFQVGEPVVFMPQVTCGECYSCRHGMYHICDQLKVMGFQTGGAAQEYFPVKAEMVLKLPTNIPLDQGAMVEPVSVAVHALRRGFGGALDGVQGKGVIVLGAGTIGNLVGQVAKALGARRVLISDISEYKLEMAHRSGLAHTIQSDKQDMGRVIVETFGPDKADLILECVGVQDTIRQAVSHARKGSTIVVVGVFGEKPQVDLGLVQDRELSLVGTLMYQKPDYERAIQLIDAGKLSLDTLVTQRFAFHDYLKAYQAIETCGGRYMKVMIEL